MYRLFVKRIIDFVFAFILLIVLLFPFLIIALVIIMDSRGGVFFCQQRIGKHGKLFKIYKFRTMVVNADKMGAFSTVKNDSRITNVGHFLRKTSLDELPQIINVLLGEMSFIGPRPDVLQQKKLYTGFEFTERHKVLPGITGLAQCLNRHKATLEERKQSDIFYANNVSFFLDVKIGLLTVKTILKGSY
ncbi:MAG: sugar transferase [Ostreibacterium sp.]